ncbi:MAG: hypothetical protein NTX64_14015 [Elusimicrobia bacterium]|nr:hypothetical protein [Elusimicrobiota bacterium]
MSRLPAFVSRLLAFILLVTFLIPSVCRAGDLEFGLGWPYVGLKANGGKLSGEARIANNEGINVFAGRLYWNFYSADNLRGFAGPEVGYVRFKTLGLKGTGYETSAFVGGQYFLTQRLSIALDIGPTLVGLKSSGYSVSGIEWVFNSAVYYRFWGGSAPHGTSDLQSREAGTRVASEPSVRTAEPPPASAENEQLQRVVARTKHAAAADHLRQADVLISSKSFSEARQELEAIVPLVGEEDVLTFHGYCRLGRISLLQKDFTDAQGQFLKALGLARRLGIQGPDVADVFVGLATSLVNLGDKSRALRSYEKALDAGPAPETRSMVEREIERLKGQE